jgi:hypothetical protein
MQAVVSEWFQRKVGLIPLPSKALCSQGKLAATSDKLFTVRIPKTTTASEIE